MVIQIDLSAILHAIGQGVLWFGGIVLLWGLMIGLANRLSKVMVIIGMVLVLSVLSSKGCYSNPEPAPVPGPSPNPGPAPAPLTTFGVGLVQAFRTDGGTVADGQAMVTMMAQISASLLFDGMRPEPAIKTTNDLGAGWARLQQNLYCTPVTPMNKFVNVSAIVMTELRKSVIGPASEPLDSARRREAARIYQEASTALMEVTR